MSHELTITPLVTGAPAASDSAAPARGPAARFRRWAKRRTYVAEQRRHERQDTSDSYIDRHGTVRLPVDSLAALVR